ncbi:MAG: OB-fold nucleic acid binding domain-containing protein [Candidatus Aenigmarchaeota archaeon]|nr:OB-fold nucleic acid binding domain-containing protein [Candidatus Aenigmarchaeota archaeon]
MEAKRITSRKVSVTEITTGRFVKKSGFESSYVLTQLGRKLSRVRLLALIVDKYLKEGSNYGAITLDDGTQTIRCKVFVNVKILDGLTKGELVDVFGKLKEYNGEVYIMPEIIRKASSNTETLRLLELEEIYKNQKSLVAQMKALPTRDAKEFKAVLKDVDPEDIDAILEADCLTEKEVAVDTKAKILDIIKEADGIDYLKIIEKSGLGENEVDQIVQDLLEKRICFEPSPGMIKVL